MYIVSAIKFCSLLYEFIFSSYKTFYEEKQLSLYVLIETKKREGFGFPLSIPEGTDVRLSVHL